MNSFKRVHALQIELEFGSKCWLLRRGKNRSTRRKTSRSKGENQQQTQATYGVDAGSWTRATLLTWLPRIGLQWVFSRGHNNKKKDQKNHWHQYKAKSQELFTQKLIEVLNSFYVYSFFWKATKLKYGGIPNIVDKTVQSPLVAHHFLRWLLDKIHMEEFATKLVS